MARPICEALIKGIEKGIEVGVEEIPFIDQMRKAMEKGVRYVVDMTDDTLEAIESGCIKLTTEKSGQMFAQTRQANGRYGTKLPIKKETFGQGVDLTQVAMALQMQALKDQLQSVVEQLTIINQSVVEIRRGQQDDRIALYYSGLSLYLESKSVTDEELRKNLITQALRALSDAVFQLELTMQSDIRYLENGEYRKPKDKDIPKRLAERMAEINKSFEVIHQTSLLRAGIYCEMGEMPAMSRVLSGYARLIEGTVAQKAKFLSECDSSDNGTERGRWRSRARLRLDVADLAVQLESPERTVYLGMREEENL